MHAIDTVTYYNRNATVNAYDYDNGNTHADWDWFAVTYDDKSRADTTIYHYDNGRQLWIDLDQDQGTAANKNFTSIYTYVDASSSLDTQTIYLDTGAKKVTDWDNLAANAATANGLGVKQSELTYTAAGAVDEYKYIYYNLSRLEVDNDVGNQTTAYNSHSMHYTAAGRLDQESYVYDANAAGVVAKESISYANVSGDGLWDVKTKAFDADGNGAIDITTSIFTNVAGQTGEKVYNALNQLVEFDYTEGGVHKFGTYGYNSAGVQNEYNYWDKDPSNGYNRHQWKDASGDNGWATYDGAGRRYSCRIEDYGQYAASQLRVVTIDNGAGIALVSKQHLTSYGWYQDALNGTQYNVVGLGGGNFNYLYNNWNTSGTSGNEWMKHEEVPWGVVDATDSLWDPADTLIFQEENWNTVDETLPMVNNDPYVTPQIDFEEQWNNEWLYL